MKKFDLTLTPKSQAPQTPDEGFEATKEPHMPYRPPPPKNTPVMGYFAVGFGLAGIFLSGVVFVPLALICSILALFMGQYVWGVIGFLLAVMGFLTTPFFLLLIGMKFLHTYLNDLYEAWFGWF